MDSSPTGSIPFWRDSAKLAILYQAIALLLVLAGSYYLYNNSVTNLEKQNIATGFGFMDQAASFEIGESMIDYSAEKSYLRALGVGVLNTIKVSFIGIILTTLLGTIIGISRLSSNWLIARLSAIYIEVFQNIPVLIQLFFWHAIFYESFPSPRQAMNPMEGVFLTNRGILYGVPAEHQAHDFMWLAFAAALVAGYFINRWAKKRQDRTGLAFPVFKTTGALIILLPLIVWFAFGAPTAMDLPSLQGFNFEGGALISPEFGSLLLGLVLYTAAFVAEIVRAGIQSVSHGQTEAAMSIGLKPGQILRLVILPQALRVIIPPLTSQMLNLTKNSSLAVAIGYPDFVSVANTTISQTGQAIEGVSMIMVVYLSISLITSLFMNWYNKKMALVER